MGIIFDLVSSRARIKQINIIYKKMAKLIFDIETAGESYDEMDETTREILTKWIKESCENEEEYERELKKIKDGLGFSPLTGYIVAIGLLDYEKNKGVVYYQAPDSSEEETEEGDFKFKPMSEKEMLERFWHGAKEYDEFIDFNGRSFDVPFLIARSAVNKVKTTKDLMSNRYLNSQRYDAKHVDLFDQLSFYGAVRGKNSLHLWCRALGVKSPKGDGVCGDDVSRLFREKKYLDIARYNVGDLVATRDLYDHWQKYMRAENKQ